MAKPKSYRPLKDVPSTAPEDPSPPAMGDNQPPEPTPLEIMTEAVDDLFLEAQNWLDGEPIASEAQAEAVTELIGRLDKAIKTVDAERKKVADPLYAEWKGINAAWKPLTEKADKAIRVAKRAMTPWLEAIQAEQRRIAEEKRREAEKAEEALRQQAIAERQSSDMADVDLREELEEGAKQAAKAARAAEKEAAVVRTETGRVGLRTFWLVNVTDYKALLRHYMELDPDWLKAIIRERAEKDVRGGIRTLPGTSIFSEQRAV